MLSSSIERSFNIKKNGLMKRLILVFAAIGFCILACGNGNDNNKKEGQTTPVSQSASDEGKKLYKKYCVACHGPKGKLALNGAKVFSESTMSLDERVVIIKEGRNMMTPFKGLLKEDEIKAVAAYTIELTKGE